MKNQFAIRLAAVSLAAITVMGAISALAAQGTAENPLVTLSYLTEVVTPQLLDKVDDVVAENEQELVEQLTALVESAQTGESGETQETYAVVSLSAGQVLKPEVGCEVMLRIGSATCISSSSPGLIDMTTGNVLNNGEALTANHLYLTTIAGRSIKAAASVKVLVKGTYSIS